MQPIPGVLLGVDLSQVLLEDQRTATCSGSAFSECPAPAGTSPGITDRSSRAPTACRINGMTVVRRTALEANTPKKRPPGLFGDQELPSVWFLGVADRH
jgi:hypothetical protein